MGKMWHHRNFRKKHCGNSNGIKVIQSLRTIEITGGIGNYCTCKRIRKRKIQIFMMSGSRGLNPHELAHKRVKDLGIRPDMSIKVG